uniref:Heat-stable enterotoxin receptor (inferred by orthology to a human protein) n=1 Tax=Strongyloides venezuelensis TaxID=75913 RepID=A0A0K0F4P9_STRVS
MDKISRHHISSSAGFMTNLIHISPNNKMASSGVCLWLHSPIFYNYMIIIYLLHLTINNVIKKLSYMLRYNVFVIDKPTFNFTKFERFLTAFDLIIIPSTTLNSPLLLGSSGYLQSAGVVTLALDQIKNENLLPDYNYTFHTFYDDCLLSRASSGAYELIRKHNVDVIFGSTCNSAAIKSAITAKFYSVPTFVWGTITKFFFYLDVVKFTILSSKCTPLQVIGFVNDLFTTFDNIIESLDVYKVETIGDGYLCVSGLPIPNGMMHAEEIALLALGFMNACNKFKIASLPDEKITVRVGCNSGPCVAGVVGLSMPRYCLFGDTINTASRMESNGKPGRIHTTESYYNTLTQLGGFDMKERGSVIIKGKGVMTTYWFNGVVGDLQYSDNSHKFEDIIEKVEDDDSKNDS